ncbi:hypothetical protein QJQ45_022061 [Haematococcus lacustris]|nr:hypothetical protein QJQ45_022061 [Haematococcus lacustris]
MKLRPVILEGVMLHRPWRNYLVALHACRPTLAALLDLAEQAWPQPSAASPSPLPRRLEGSRGSDPVLSHVTALVDSLELLALALPLAQGKRLLADESSSSLGAGGLGGAGPGGLGQEPRTVSQSELLRLQALLPRLLDELQQRLRSQHVRPKQLAQLARALNALAAASPPTNSRQPLPAALHPDGEAQHWEQGSGAAQAGGQAGEEDEGEGEEEEDEEGEEEEEEEEGEEGEEVPGATAVASRSALLQRLPEGWSAAFCCAVLSALPAASPAALTYLLRALSLDRVKRLLRAHQRLAPGLMAHTAQVADSLSAPQATVIISCAAQLAWDPRQPWLEALLEVVCGSDNEAAAPLLPAADAVSTLAALARLSAAPAPRTAGLLMLAVAQALEPAQPRLPRIPPSSRPEQARSAGEQARNPGGQQGSAAGDQQQQVQQQQPRRVNLTGSQHLYPPPAPPPPLAPAPLTGLQLSSCLWAVARLGLRPPHTWLQAFMATSYARLQAFTAPELVSMCWALAKLQWAVAPAWSEAVWGALLACRLKGVRPSHLGRLAWALSVLKPPASHPLLPCLMDRAAQLAPRLDGRAVSQLLLACGRLNYLARPGARTALGQRLEQLLVAHYGAPAPEPDTRAPRLWPQPGWQQGAAKAAGRAGMRADAAGGGSGQVVDSSLGPQAVCTLCWGAVQNGLLRGRPLLVASLRSACLVELRGCGAQELGMLGEAWGNHMKATLDRPSQSWLDAYLAATQGVLEAAAGGGASQSQPGGGGERGRGRRVRVPPLAAATMLRGLLRLGARQQLEGAWLDAFFRVTEHQLATAFGFKELEVLCEALRISQPQLLPPLFWVSAFCDLRDRLVLHRACPKQLQSQMTFSLQVMRHAWQKQAAARDAAVALKASPPLAVAQGITATGRSPGRRMPGRGSLEAVACMASKKEVPVVPDFDSADYGQSADTIRTDAVHSALDYLLSRANEQINFDSARKAALAAAVDSALGAALVAIDLLYVARDDKPVSTISLMHGSWEAEAAPQPCAIDTWVRAAIPDSQQPKQSFALTEYLRAPATTSTPSAGLSWRNQSSSGTATAAPASPSATPGRSARSPPSMRQAIPPPAGRSPPTAAKEQAAAEARLREELAVRQAQRAATAGLEAREQEARARLAGLTQALKGKEYVYDHAARLLPLAPFAPDKAPALQAGPGFRVKTPDTAAPAVGALATAGKSPGKLGTKPGSGSAGERERKLANDFREMEARTQPNALETLAPSQGVTLRQGSQAKMGMRKAAPPGTGMTHEEVARLAARSQAQAGGAARPAGASSPSPSAAEPQGPRLAAGSTAAPGTGPQPGTGRAAGGGLFAGLPDSDPLAVGARLREASAAQPKPRTPDVNPGLVAAPDWGRSAGQGRATMHPPLAAVKPGTRTSELEMGRAVRLPRDRTSQATASPPLSPGKLAAPPPTARMTFAG